MPSNPRGSDMADIKKAMDLVSKYQDPPSKKMQGFDWRKLRDVQEDLGGLDEIPSHVEDFGAYMDDMARKAATVGLSPRDLIKAYAITRSSIQRRSQKADRLRESGLELPPSATGNIRPEGAMAEWLKTKMGQRYLDAAEMGKVDQEAVAHAQQVMKPFGINTELQALPWAAQNLHDKHKIVSDMVKRAISGNSPVAEWREFGKGLSGIGTAKAGFAASMLGRGDQPTLDARQVVLQTGMPTKEAAKPLARAGFDAVDRLAARQTALNPKMQSGLEPFRQHLTHHAIWDKTGNEQTTHSDVIDAMKNAKDGGRIGYADGGSPKGKPLSGGIISRAIASLGVEGHNLPMISGQANKEMVRQALESAKTSGFTRTGAGLMQRDPRLQESQPSLSAIKPTKKSGHLITPFSELQAEFAPKNNLSPQKYADIESMQREGAYIRPLVGDKTPADTILLGHHGTGLVDPVDQQGGGDYMRSEFSRTNQPTGWRSREGASKGMQSRIGKDIPEGAPVYGAHMLMGDVAGDSSHMLLHSVINQVPNLPIAKRHIDAFDEEMRSKFPHDEKYPMPWPGIMNTKGVHDFFYSQPTVVRGKGKNPDTIRMQPRPGKHVSDFLKNMDSVRWQSTGFPSVASARFANIHPDLMAEPQGATGYGITKLDPKGSLVANDEMRAHGTYTHGIPTLGYAGRLRALVPASKLFEEHVRNAKNPTEVQQTLMTKFPAAKVDQRVVDLVKGAEEERMKKYGFKSGGKAKNIDRALALTSVYNQKHNRDA